MQKRSNEKTNSKAELIVCAVFSLTGLFFSIGLELIAPSIDRSLLSLIIHLLSPAALLGLVGLFFAPGIVLRRRTGAFGYSVFGLLGIMSVFIILAILENGTQLGFTQKAYYFACWFGFFMGITLRFAIDEAIGRKAKDESRT